MFFRWFLGFFALISLVGCTSVYPRQLGISQNQWQQYSDVQKEQIIANYAQAKRIQKEQKVEKGDSKLEVKVYGGSVLMPPYTNSKSYQPITFEIKEGDCHLKIPVYAAISKEKTILKACYSDAVLYLDPSPYNPNLAKGALQFPYMPVWKRGFTYPPMNSEGLTKLRGGRVSILEIDNNHD